MFGLLNALRNVRSINIERTCWRCVCGHRWERQDTKRPRRCPECRATRGLHKAGEYRISAEDIVARLDG